jgi:hypothetical protein
LFCYCYFFFWFILFCNAHTIDNKVWFQAFQKVIQRPWRTIHFFPWRTAELQAKHLLSDYVSGSNNGNSVPVLGKTFGLFCDHFLNVKNRYLDDTMVVFYLLFPSLVTAKYFDAIPVSGFYPNAKDTTYQIKFHDSSKVVKMCLDTKRTREYIEEIKRYLFEPLM